MKISDSILVVIFSLCLVSCGSGKHSVDNFSQLPNTTYLDGCYETKSIKQSDSLYSQTNGNLLRCLGIYADSINFVNLKFDKKNITITFQTDSALHKKSYKGKFKKNYFEVYLSRKIAPIPVFYFGWDWERARIGLDKDKNLLIQYWQYNFGWILFGTAGGLEDKEYTFSKKTGD